MSPTKSEPPSDAEAEKKLVGALEDIAHDRAGDPMESAKAALASVRGETYD